MPHPVHQLPQTSTSIGGKLIAGTRYLGVADGQRMNPREGWRVRANAEDVEHQGDEHLETVYSVTWDSRLAVGGFAH